VESGPQLATWRSIDQRVRGVELSGRSARYYDPSTGQFLTVDPLVAMTATPYGYAGNNPINRMDRSGLDSDCSGETTSAATYTTLSASSSELPPSAFSGATYTLVGIVEGMLGLASSASFFMAMVGFITAEGLWDVVVAIAWLGPAAYIGLAFLSILMALMGTFSNFQSEPTSDNL
jgi:RHS repeat-associated protein